jgi:hypothetical protein
VKKILVFLLTSVAIISCQKDHENPVKQTDSKLITDWIGLHLTLIKNTTGVTHIAYSRHFAYTGIALYEALVNVDPRFKTVANSLNGNISLPVATNKQVIFYPAAANAALAEMLRFFYSAKEANVFSIDSLEQVESGRFTGDMIRNRDIPASIDYGRKIAQAIIQWSGSDGSVTANSPYTPLGEGFWEPTPSAFAPANMPGWGNNRPLMAGSISNTLPEAPTPFSTQQGTAFHAMVKDLYEVSLTLTDDQKATARFWDDAPNGKYVSVFGHWFSILKQVLVKEKTPLMKGAEAYLRLGVTMHEAAITCWKAKYTYNQIRPVTYIRKHMGFADWSPLIATPPHPEYPAAHPTLSGSAAYALEYTFGSAYVFTDHTYDAIGYNPRTFGSFDLAGKEAGRSRLYGGIHYRLSIEAGYAQGRKVGSNIVNLLHTH